jgi:hypothetical protein
MSRFFRSALWLAIAAALGGAAGCGPAHVKVTGKVTKDGKPLPPSQTGHVEVRLLPADAAEHYTTKVGIADDAGSFEILDVPTGKYKVAVVEMGDPTNPASDALKGQFNEQNTKIIRDIDGKPLNIELTKPEG